MEGVSVCPTAVMNSCYWGGDTLSYLTVDSVFPPRRFVCDLPLTTFHGPLWLRLLCILHVTSLTLPCQSENTLLDHSPVHGSTGGWCFITTDQFSASANSCLCSACHAIHVCLLWMNGMHKRPFKVVNSANRWSIQASVLFLVPSACHHNTWSSMVDPWHPRIPLLAQLSI